MRSGVRAALAVALATIGAGLSACSDDQLDASSVAAPSPESPDESPSAEPSGGQSDAGDDLAPDTAPGSAPDTAASSTTDPTTTTTVMSMGPASYADDPIVAVDAAGDAVLLSVNDPTPILLFDGPDPTDPAIEDDLVPNVVDQVAASPDGDVVFVGTCCEPISGVILTARPPAPAVAGEGGEVFGYGPAVSPDGRFLAAGQILGSPVTIIDLEGGDRIEIPAEADRLESYSPYDTMWLDDRRVASLGLLPADDDGGLPWVVYLIELGDDGATVSDPVRLEFATTSALVPPVYFAGQPDSDHFAVHRRGDAAATMYGIDGSGRPEVVFDVGEPAGSIWLSNNRPPLWVGADGALHLGDDPLPGSYSWARW